MPEGFIRILPDPVFTMRDSIKNAMRHDRVIDPQELARMLDGVYPQPHVGTGRLTPWIPDQSVIDAYKMLIENGDRTDMARLATTLGIRPYESGESNRMPPVTLSEDLTASVVLRMLQARVQAVR